MASSSAGPMKYRIRLFFLFGLAALATACGSGPGGKMPDASGEPVSVGTTNSSTFCMILVGPDGKPLYTRAGDTATSSTCTGSCATAWPPLTVPPGQQAVGGPGVNGTFSTLTRSDGTLQATYNGLPLYYYGADSSTSGPTGNGIDGFAVATPSSGGS